MNRFVTYLLAAALASVATAAAAAMARIEFENPASFSDAGRPRVDADRGDTLAKLRDHLVRETARRLPEGETLFLWITDVDLAGEFEPTQPYYNEVRIVKDRYPPRIELRFRLVRADGSTVKEGMRTLRDAAFLLHGSLDRQDPLRYEKAMLDRWLDDEFRK